MLKKVIFFITLFSTIFIVKPMKTLYNRFSWNKTTINVPLNESIENYLDEIEVKFYYNGVLTDNEVYIKIDDFYYGSVTIPTNEACTKMVRVIAYVDGYSSYDRREITVNIVDNEAPKITLLKPLDFKVSEVQTLAEYFDISDNDQIKSIQFDDSLINYNVIGTYPLKVIAVDLSNNITSKNYQVNVRDKMEPVIISNVFIEVAYGDESFDITKFVSATDDYDGDITTKVKLYGLDVYKLGSQITTLEVSDSSGNVRRIEKEIMVVDNQAPKLELSTYNVTIMQSLNVDFSSYIKEISDNYDELSVDDIEIIKDDFKQEIGTYPVYFKASDSAGNYTLRTLLVNVSYDTAPVIYASDFTVKRYTNVNIYDYVAVTDLYDQYVEESLVISPNEIKTDETGVYEIIIEACNSAGIKSKKTIYMTVVDGDLDGNKFLNFIYDNKYTLIFVIISITGGVIYIILKKKKKLKI